MKVLVVDDDPEVRSVVGRALEAEGYELRAAGTLAEARSELRLAPDLLVLDLGLPDGSGLTLCREVRASGATLPILVLTAQSRVASRVEGLDAGADDYLAKPFAIAELRARLRALGRRVTTEFRDTARLSFALADVQLDLDTRSARVAGAEVPITAREWAILEVLLSRAGALVPRNTLLELVWGQISESSSNSLDVLLTRLRKKLGTQVVRSVRGVGVALGGEP